MNEWYCPECNMKNPGSLKTCSSCGYKKAADVLAANQIQIQSGNVTFAIMKIRQKQINVSNVVLQSILRKKKRRSPPH